MLVLKRKIRQMVEITVAPSDKPQTIVVAVLDYKGGGVVLGFDGDKRAVSILRSNTLMPVPAGDES